MKKIKLRPPHSAAFVLTLLLAACGAPETQSALPGNATPRASDEGRVGVVPQSLDRERGIDRFFLNVAKENPGFVSFYVNNDKKPVFLITKGYQEASIKDKLFKTFEKEIRIRKNRNAVLETTTSADSIIIQVKYELNQLMLWKSAIRANILGKHGVGTLDFNESKGLIDLGLSANTNIGGIQALLVELGIPLDAVEFSEAPVIKLASTLFDLAPRPIAGGLGIAAGTQTCTIGFNAVLDGVYGFFTAGHCTGPNGVQTDAVATQGGQPIGQEINDPPLYNTGGDCTPCRQSDASFFKYDNQKSRLGKLAKTTAIGYNNNPGSVNVSGRFDVVGKQDFPYLNDQIQKVGFVTGWTGGTVTQTCVDFPPPETDPSLRTCSDVISTITREGDSGGPAFYNLGPNTYGGNDRVLIGGLVWASFQYSSGNEATAMSSIINMQQDFGYFEVTTIPGVPVNTY